MGNRQVIQGSIKKLNHKKLNRFLLIPARERAWEAIFHGVKIMTTGISGGHD
jgi:hypothetical protein